MNTMKLCVLTMFFVAHIFGHSANSKQQLNAPMMALSHFQHISMKVLFRKVVYGRCGGFGAIGMFISVHRNEYDEDLPMTRSEN